MAPTRTQGRGRWLPGWTETTALKVPEVTIIFWVIKVLTTAMGEATSDYFVHRFDPVVVVPIAGLVFLAALAVQLRFRRYVPAVYWTTVVMVAVFGTMAADVLHVRFSVPYGNSVVLFGIVLAVVFRRWKKVEGTLSIHSIDTMRRELFYWTTIATTFAFGTAVGDLTAYTFHLGFLSSGLLFIGIIAVPAIAYRWGGLGGVPAFWAAYIVTRPLGASFADWFGTPHNVGGLDGGRGTVSLLLTAAIVVLVAYLSTERPPISLGEAR